MKIKTEENVIKDIDVNVVMDIKLYTNKKILKKHIFLVLNSTLIKYQIQNCL